MVSQRGIAISLRPWTSRRDGLPFDELHQGATDTAADMIGVNREDLDESMIG